MMLIKAFEAVGADVDAAVVEVAREKRDTH
jgi:hypothetical protein